MKRIALSIILTTFAFAAALAVPAKPGVMTHKQSDGTIVTYEIFGDEYNNYIVADGLYTVLRDASGDFCYAIAENGLLKNSGVKVRTSSRLSTEEKKIAQNSIGIRRTAFNPYFNAADHSPEAAMARAAANIQNAAKKHEAALEIAEWGGKVEGKRNLLVLLVEYADVKFSIDDPSTKFNNLLNQTGYNENNATGSAKDYFTASSSGKFVPTFDVMGPYTLSNKRSYYGGNDGRGDDMRPAYQAEEACHLANGEVDFSKYDYDSDGAIDLVFVLYAGHNPAEGGPDEAVWPHMWNIYPGYNIESLDYPVLDGKKFTKYACSSELRGRTGTNMVNIGTFCHEFGHALGLPDWYNVDYSSNNLGLSYVSVMNSGNYLNDGATPPTHNALERWLLGWTLPKELNATGSYELTHISNNDTYVMWANDKQSECFLFEAHPKAANYVWDKYLNDGDSALSYAGGEGMLVYHIDWSGKYYDYWANHKINTEQNHECVKLFGADGTTPKQSKQWFFPGSRNVTSLVYGDLPSFKNWAGSPMPIELINITISGDRVFFEATSKEFEVSIRQYDALLDWTASPEESSKWTVTYTNKETEEMISVETTNKYILLSPLHTSSHYHAMVFKAGDSEPLYEAEILTHSKALKPIPALNISSSYKKSDIIRLSVKNLESEPESIQWYVDRQPTDELILTLNSGKHHICAVVTDKDGNNSYLYRYITVK